jgi:HK97 family phage prohead protease
MANKMKAEFKTFALKLDNVKEEEGILEGFASTFGNVDLGDDIMEKGAFKKTLSENKGIVPILADHNPSSQIGWNLEAKETSEGLWVRGQIELKTQLGQEKYALAKKALEIGAKMGLSIGYSPVKVEFNTDKPGIRRIKEVKLWEYSLVTFPMNQDAMVTAAKSWTAAKGSISDLCSSFAEYAKTLGFSPSEISNALHSFGAAPKSFDPLKVGQSIDKMIQTLKTGGN